LGVCGAPSVSYLKPWPFAETTSIGKTHAMSAFTALNGASPKAAEPPSIKVDSSATEEQKRNATPPPAPHPTGEGLPSRRESFERPTIQTAGHPSSRDGSLKRKRSPSRELPRDHLIQERTPDTATVPPHGEHRDPFGTPKREHQQQSPENRERDPWNPPPNRDERSPYGSRPGSAVSPQAQTDEQIGDALRRATSHTDHGDYPNTSPEADDRSVSYYGGQYSSEHRQSSILQHDPKKRKRNFSNRTKTGCMTCRKRKKKCDETKPECMPIPLDPPLAISSSRANVNMTKAKIASRAGLCVQATRLNEGQGGRSQTTSPLRCPWSLRTPAMCLRELMACRSKDHSPTSSR
jgi:hypothetical protein